MKISIAISFLICSLFLGQIASAHKLDEYLQETMFTLTSDRVEGEIQLTPGVKVFPQVMAKIDANKDGRCSGEEQQAYAKKVLEDLSMSIDGKTAILKLTACTFPDLDEMRKGEGEINLEFYAELSPSTEVARTLIFTNKHLEKISAYTMNTLVPKDGEILKQRRNNHQSIYEVDFKQAQSKDHG